MFRQDCIFYTFWAMIVSILQKTWSIILLAIIMTSSTLHFLWPWLVPNNLAATNFTTLYTGVVSGSKEWVLQNWLQYLTTSVTRFGQILQLWWNFNRVWVIFYGLFCFGTILTLLWQKIMPFGKVNSQNWKHNWPIWSHCQLHTFPHLPIFLHL